MTVDRLIALAYKQVGADNPSPEEVQIAFDHLNMIVSNFAYWDDSVQPIKFFSTLDETINLPPYYMEVFELLLAAREGRRLGAPANEVTMYETKAKQLADRIVYRITTSKLGSRINPTSQVM